MNGRAIPGAYLFRLYVCDKEMSWPHHVGETHQPDWVVYVRDSEKFRLTDVIPERIIFVSRGITVYTLRYPNPIPCKIFSISLCDMCPFVSSIMTEVSTTLTEVFPLFFLSCKANARVKLAKSGHGPHLFRIIVFCVVLVIVLCYRLYAVLLLLYVVLLLYCSVIICVVLCIDCVYCTTATGC